MTEHDNGRPPSPITNFRFGRWFDSISPDFICEVCKSSKFQMYSSEDDVPYHLSCRIPEVSEGWPCYFLICSKCCNTKLFSSVLVDKLIREFEKEKNRESPEGSKNNE